MSNKCKIYYGIVVEANGDQRWAGIGSCSMEPIKVEGQKPIGKEPEFCCDNIKHGIEGFLISFYYRLGEEVGLHFNRPEFSYSPRKLIYFCPFCGAKIVFIEHLKLKVIETPITRHEYHYEVV